MLSVMLLPRQFQVMVVENVDERHVRRAAWAFPAYLLLINLFVLPIALGGLLYFGGQPADPETFVLSLPLAGGMPALALAGLHRRAVGGHRHGHRGGHRRVHHGLQRPGAAAAAARAALPGATSRRAAGIRRAVIVALLLLGWLYFRVAGEAYALVSIGLISFAAVAQFAPALLGGMYWKGGTRNGALAGLAAGALLWAYTLMLPSIAKSGWMDAAFLQHGLFGLALLRPEALLGLAGHGQPDPRAVLEPAGQMAAVRGGVAAGAAAGARGQPGAAVRRRVRARRAKTACSGAAAPRPPTWWRWWAASWARRAPSAVCGLRARGGAACPIEADAQAGAVCGDAAGRRHRQRVGARDGGLGGAGEDTLGLDDVMRIVEEASELRHVNEQLKSLDRLKDDFMSSVTHELRTPLTSIRALAELMRDDPEMDAAQRQQFLGMVVAEPSA
jgi:hypothetical protein